MSKKNSQHVVLFNMLKSGEPCHINDILSTLKCELVTAMGYVFTLRNKFGADIQTIRNGRKAEFYKLTNSTAVAKRLFGTSTVAATADTAEASESNDVVVSDEYEPATEFDDYMSDLDLRAEIGLGESYVE